MLGDDVRAALPGFRAQAVSMMSETVSVGVYVDGVDPDTLTAIRILTEEHYSAIGQIKYPSVAVSDRVAASQQAGIAQVVLKIPVDSGPLIRPNDEVVVTASLVDQTLVGRRFRVTALPQSGNVSAHRYPLEELS